MNGIQLWIALPEEQEECAAAFQHHPKEDLPEFAVGGAKVKLLLGHAFGKKSPVQIHSDLFYAETFVPAGERLQLPHEGREMAAYVVTGKINIDGTTTQQNEMAILQPGANLTLIAEEASHIMLIGGVPFGGRKLFWNFVSSSSERIEEAKKLWSAGPGPHNTRFHSIPGDDREWIPLPEEVPPPKGTIL
ncbi:MAG: pirin family protein [Proteobacteria bacterium]|nr:MAG: pirin family protein [Pseudomonadota bacterium]